MITDFEVSTLKEGDLLQFSATQRNGLPNDTPVFHLVLQVIDLYAGRRPPGAGVAVNTLSSECSAITGMVIVPGQLGWTLLR